MNVHTSDLPHPSEVDELILTAAVSVLINFWVIEWAYLRSFQSMGLFKPTYGR